VIRYPPNELLGEVAFIAYYFHWAQSEVMGLEHADRRRWVEEISAINRAIGDGA
jgi:hypothetical protein